MRSGRIFCSTHYLLRKSLIGRHGIPYITNRSFNCYACKNTAMNTSIFLNMNTCKNFDHKFSSFSELRPTHSNFSAGELPKVHQIYGDEFHPPHKACQDCKFFQMHPSYWHSPHRKTRERNQKLSELNLLCFLQVTTYYFHTKFYPSHFLAGKVSYFLKYSFRLYMPRLGGSREDRIW